MRRAELAIDRGMIRDETVTEKCGALGAPPESPRSTVDGLKAHRVGQTEPGSGVRRCGLAMHLRCRFTVALGVQTGSPGPSVLL
eukprot:367245-Alexandrium_andersonii.AAC.1